MSLDVGASVFVGRVAELAALEAAFERTTNGQPSAVFIGGEAGVGSHGWSASSPHGSNQGNQSNQKTAPRCCTGTAWS